MNTRRSWLKNITDFSLKTPPPLSFWCRERVMKFTFEWMSVPDENTDEASWIQRYSLDIEIRVTWDFTIKLNLPSWAFTFTSLAIVYTWLVIYFILYYEQRKYCIDYRRKHFFCIQPHFYFMSNKSGLKVLFGFSINMRFHFYLLGWDHFQNSQWFFKLKETPLEICVKNVFS